jgi:hypothetical protein
VNRIANFETNRPQVEHDATLDDHHDSMCLRLVQPATIISP